MFTRGFSGNLTLFTTWTAHQNTLILHPYSLHGLGSTSLHNLRNGKLSLVNFFLKFLIIKFSLLKCFQFYFCHFFKPTQMRRQNQKLKGPLLEVYFPQLRQSSLSALHRWTGGATETEEEFHRESHWHEGNVCLKWRLSWSRQNHMRPAIPGIW